MAHESDALSLGNGARRLPVHVQLLYKCGVGRADLIIAQTSTQQSSLEDVYAHRSVIIPNVCSTTDQHVPHVARHSVIWVGNLKPIKRPELFLRIADKCPELSFRMVAGCHDGSDTYYAHIRNLVTSRSNLAFAGELSVEEVETELSGSAVLVLTSVAEGFPNVLLQAWNVGTPTISTFDPDGVIERHQLGYHCVEINGIVERARWLSSRARVREQMGKRARAYVRQFHDPGVVLDRLESSLLGLREASKRT